MPSVTAKLIQLFREKARGKDILVLSIKHMYHQTQNNGLLWHIADGVVLCAYHETGDHLYGLSYV